MLKKVEGCSSFESIFTFDCENELRDEENFI